MINIADQDMVNIADKLTDQDTLNIAGNLTDQDMVFTYSW